MFLAMETQISACCVLHHPLPYLLDEEVSHQSPFQLLFGKKKQKQNNMILYGVEGDYQLHV